MSNETALQPKRTMPVKAESKKPMLGSRSLITPEFCADLEELRVDATTNEANEHAAADDTDDERER